MDIPATEDCPLVLKDFNHIVMYSGGVGSWMAAKRVAAKYGTNRLHLLFTDTMIEDEDLYRFLEESALNVGGTLHKVAEGRDPFEVFKDVRMMGNSRRDPCSRILKREMADKWIAKNFKPENTRVYVGIDWSEEHRYLRMIERKLPWVYKAPLTEPPYLRKDQMFMELSAEGIEIPKLYKMGFMHNNCFSGDEKFITNEGVKTFKETAGTNVKVFGSGKGTPWLDAEVKSFGKQKIVELTVKRNSVQKVIKTTADHRWFVRVGRNEGTKEKEMLTKDLLPGDALVSRYQMLQAGVRPSAFGIARGIVFGDGTRSSKWNNPAWITLCGDKDRQLLKYFPLQPTQEVEPGIQVRDLPRTWKDRINLDESKSVLYGWLSGYFAADGCVSKSDIKLSSSKIENIEHAADICSILGIGYNPIRKEVRLGLGKEKTALYTLSMVPSTLKEDFFLIEDHRERFMSKKRHAPGLWNVLSVVETDVYEEVFCCVVPEGHRFTLENNILTGNCGGFCIKTGQAQFKKLYEEMPERYLELEKREEDVYKHIGSRHPFIRMTIDKKMHYLSMRDFRTQYLEPDSKEIDVFDWGGCGCFIDDPE